MALPPSSLRACVPMALLAWIALFGCGDGSLSSQSVETAPPSQIPQAFEREGVPGPWWRRGATREAFDVEHRVCLARSREARTAAAGGDPADAAYRAFLECMAQHSWSRGLPPSG